MITASEFEIAAAELAAVPNEDRASVYAYAARLFKRLNPRFDEARFQTAIAYHIGQRETGQDRLSKA